jgi:hypothetical protein
MAEIACSTRRVCRNARSEKSEMKGTLSSSSSSSSSILRRKFRGRGGGAKLIFQTGSEETSGPAWNLVHAGTLPKETTLLNGVQGKPLSFSPATFTCHQLPGGARSASVSGNVIVSCKKCNNEKRRDDQLHELTLAKTGWESFLSHDSTKCGEHCKTCVYWKTIWPDEMRAKNLKAAHRKILEFRSRYAESIELNRKAHDSLRRKLDKIYRECQSSATDRIKKAVEAVA